MIWQVSKEEAALLIERDERFAPLVERYGLLSTECYDQVFPGLICAVLSQQLSDKVWRKLLTQIPPSILQEPSLLLAALHEQVSFKLGLAKPVVSPVLNSSATISSETNISSANISSVYMSEAHISNANTSDALSQETNVSSVTKAAHQVAIVATAYHDAGAFHAAATTGSVSTGAAATAGAVSAVTAAINGNNSRVAPRLSLVLPFSQAKLNTIKALALAFKDGALSEAKLRELSRAEREQLLLSFKGVGPWTVSMVELLVLQERDCFAYRDLGVQLGYGKMIGCDMRRLKPKERLTLLESYAPKLSPVGSIANFYLWQLNNDK